MTCAPAPGTPGTVDGTGAAASQITAFAGTVVPADLTLAGQAVVSSKPDEWSFRRHILHYARLAQAAGGVDGFIIGSEMVGLSHVRSASGIYPFVSVLQGVAADCRAMLGPQTRITYAADWTEYGAHALAGGGEVRFPLDPLWASPAISAVGIDYYAPITDWRDGISHADASIARSQHDLDYLCARQVAGEAFDWFYANPAARDAQARTPITDGLGKSWIFRPKDLANWWSNPHRERINGAELASNTPWVPGSKPIWLTEIGCPAVDKGANSPNVFPDPKSSEGARPAFSSGERDDLAQLRMLEAQIGVFDPASPRHRPAANPVSASGLRMVSPADIAVWAWDARPFPDFPKLETVWSDGGNWLTGHWLNGRLEAAPLDRLIGAILDDHGLPPALRLEVDHIVDGYVIDRPMSPREALQPLARLFGLDTSFEEGRLSMRSRSFRTPLAIAAGDLVPDREGKPLSLVRAQESELPRELRLGFIDGDFEYRRAASRSRRLAGAARRETAIDGAVVTGRAAADRLAELRLQDVWAARETVSFALSPRLLALEPGDMATLMMSGQPRLFRVLEIVDGDVRRVTAVSAQRSAAPTRSVIEAPRPAPTPPLAGRPFAAILELPLAQGEPVALSYLAAHARPWPGALDVLRSVDGTSFASVAEITRPALVGRLMAPLAPGPLWRWDRNAAIEVEIATGALQSVGDLAALAGQNVFAVQGEDGAWEVLAAVSATLIGPQRYRLTQLMRGLGGSEDLASRTAPAGALFVGVDEALVPLAQGLRDLGRPLRHRIAPRGLDAADPAVVELAGSAQGLALRPMSPVHVKARRSAAGIAFSWIRRARVDGDGWDLAEPPLGEASERYQFDILSGSTLLRRFVVSGPALLYPSAQEVADFGAVQGTIDIALCQLSEAVGPGTIRQARITLV